MTDNNIDPDRRAYLLDKFPAITRTSPMAPHVSTQVRATDRAEMIVQRVWFDGDKSPVLFDPVLCPPMAQRAEAAAAELRRARERVTWETADSEYDPDAPAEQGVVRIWFVGSRTVEVVRERWHDHPNRKPKPGEYFAGMLAHMRRDYATEFDCDTTCNVGIAKACGGPTRVLPANRGTLVLLFRCCRECEELAGQITNNNRQVNARIAELSTGLSDR